MSVRAAVALDADDAAFVAAALKLLVEVLDQQCRRPVPRVAELARQLSAAAAPKRETTKPVDAWGGDAEVTGDRISVATAAERLGISEVAVRRHARRGRLDAERVAGRWLIELDSVEQLLTERKDIRAECEYRRVEPGP